MTFRTKFKIGETVKWEGRETEIQSVSIVVSAFFKRITYRLETAHATEDELLRINPRGRS